MKSTATIAGYRTLEGRYALLECIAVSTIGKIYQGRDLEQARSHGMDSRILIHLLPSSLNKLPMETVFQQISRTYEQARHEWIMPPRAFGQDENNSYIVMDSPSGRNLTSYVRQANADNSTLSRQLHPLVKKGLVTKQVDPALLVTSTDNHLYLLATALSPDIQALQSLSQPASIKCKTLHMLAAGLSLGLLSILSAMAANYLFKPETLTARITHTYEPAEPTSPPLQLASLAHQIGENPQILVNSDRELSEPNDNLPLEDITTANPQAETQLSISSQTEKTEEQVSAFPAKTVKTKAEKTVEKAKAPDKSKQPAPLKTATTHQDKPQQKAAKSTQESESLDFNKLVELAETAMGAGRYGDNRTGALYYTRQVRSLSHLHPQVKRLSQAIVSHHHQQTRAALIQHDIEQAEQLLKLSKAIIKEFNLVAFNPAQTLLEHKAAAMQ